MNKNVGTADKAIRLATGALFLILPMVSGLALFSNILWTTASVVVGLVLIGTALLNFCPMYRLLGMGTRQE